jgi:hypothetical protein
VACDDCPSFQMTDSILEKNQASVAGGALLINPLANPSQPPSLTTSQEAAITSCQIRNNSVPLPDNLQINWDPRKLPCAPGGGGGICVQLWTPVTIRKSVISGNSGRWGGKHLVLLECCCLVALLANLASPSHADEAHQCVVTI